VRELLVHDRETAGGIMAKEFVAVDQDAPVDAAIQEIRRRAGEVGEVYNVYAVDREGRLTGVLSLKKLLLAPPNARVRDVMDPRVISVQTHVDQEEVAHIVRKYDLVSIPVVDKEGKLVGCITVDDIVDVLEKEASEDISRMAGLIEAEFQETSPWRLSRVRLPWLLFAFAGELVTGLIMSKFEASLSRILAIVFFVPLIMAIGGSAGNQAAVIVVRGLATGEIGLVDTRRQLLREFAVAFLNGLFLALLIFVIATFWLQSYRFGLVIGLAMMVVILNATVIGASIPFLLKRFKVDPAIATSPFISTSNDILGLFVYFGLVTLFMKWLL